MSLWKGIRPLKVLIPGRVSSAVRISVDPPTAPTQPVESTPKPPQPICASTPQKFLKSLKRLVVNRQNAYASDIFHKVMKVRFQSRERSHVFALATDLFLKYGHVKEATQIYSYMTLEGLIPPTKLRAAMYVVRRVALEPFPSAEAVLAASEAMVKQKIFDEECLRFLLGKLLQVYDIPLEVIEQIAEMYVQAQPSGYTWSPRTQGYVAAICNRLRLDSQLSSSSPGLSSKRNLPELDVKELESLANSGPENLREVASLARHILRRPQPDHALLNSLARLYLKHHRYEHGFAIYRLILDADTGGPTVQLYSIVLRMVARLSKRRPAMSRRPANTPSLRDVYREMLGSHLKFTRKRPQRHSNVFNGMILNQAIQYFTMCEDYCAAFVVLRSLRICRIPVTLDTYKCVLSPLVDRLDVEIPQIRANSDSEAWWALRFLGFPDRSNLRVDINMIDAIRDLGEDPNISLRPLAWTKEGRAARLAQILSRKRRRYHIPFAADLIGLTGPGRKKYSEVPLSRILRRAILAVPRQTFVAPAVYVSRIIREAKEDMVPDASWWKQKMESHKLRFGAHSRSNVYN